MERFIPTRTHAAIGYLAGVVLLFVPNIFGFSDNGGAAVMVPRIVGIITLLSESMADNGLSLMGLVPMRIHLIMDMGVALFLAVSPWLFGFHDQGTNAWLPLLIAGLTYFGVAAVTQTQPSRARRVHA
jgi:hypothetical protein